MNTLKITALLALLPATLVHANTTNQAYVAISGGVLQANFTSDYLDQTDLIPQNISNLSQQEGYTGGLAIGFTHPLNASYSLGLQFSGNLDGDSALFQSGASNTAFSDEIKMRHHADLSLITALTSLSTYSPYIKLGLSYASIRDSLVSPVGYNPAMIQYSSNKAVYGFAAGLGVKHSVGEHLGLFAEANYHDYGHQKLSNFQNFSANYTHRTRLCTYAFTLGAAYTINV